VTTVDDETAERGSIHNARVHVASKVLADLERKITGAAAYINAGDEHHTPERMAQALSDRELLTFITWGVEHNVIRSEYERRQARYQEQARRFTSRDHAEFVTILAERVSS
jgi:hypothetical protein